MKDKTQNNLPVSEAEDLPEDLKACIAFHGHLCPGLVYGYRVAKEAMARLHLERAQDEEIVAISENDSCAVDALQIMLGTTMGKGNLLIRDFGKNAFSILNRKTGKGLRFVRTSPYQYQGDRRAEFDLLEAAQAQGRATTEQQEKQKWLKALDLLSQPFEVLFATQGANLPEPSYAPLAPSELCSQCGEATMATKMVESGSGGRLCRPCAEASGLIRTR